PRKGAPDGSLTTPEIVASVAPYASAQQKIASPTALQNRFMDRLPFRFAICGALTASLRGDRISTMGTRLLFDLSCSDSTMSSDSRASPHPRGAGVPPAVLYPT